MSNNTGRYSGKPTGGNPWGAGVRNGRIPLSKMRLMASQPHFSKSNPAGYLYPPAAILLDQMAAAARADGVRLHVLVGYRPYAEQVRMREVWRKRGKPNYAATPGTSTHGLGVTIDVDRKSPGTERVIWWLQQHARRFGWDHPWWAGDGIKVEEPWHWQFIDGFQPDEEPIRWALENGDAVLRLGEYDGPDQSGPISRLQAALRAWSLSRPDVGLGDDLKIDGWFGEQTRDVVEVFQADQGILPREKAMRGVAGPTTRGRLAVLTGKAV